MRPHPSKRLIVILSFDQWLKLEHNQSSYVYPLIYCKLYRICSLTPQVTPHILRHTFATLALQKGISLASFQKALGHDRLETTAIYLNFTDAHVMEEFSSKW